MRRTRTGNGSSGRLLSQDFCFFRLLTVKHRLAHATIHPYTRSLLSAIPLPNPVVEKRRVAETYDYATSGID